MKNKWFNPIHQIRSNTLYHLIFALHSSSSALEQQKR